MKKILILLPAFILILAGAGCERPAQPRATGNPNPELESSLMPAEEYSYEQVSEHSTADDCWVVVDKVVYDVTDFIGSHQGGSEAVTRWCGQDATEGFKTKNGLGEEHSVRSKLNLDLYFQGNLSQ